jgi:hypothetical protein
MKRIASGLISFSLLCLLNASSFGVEKGWKENVEIKQQVWVIETLVKPGKYQVSYDPSTSEMSVKRGDKLIVKVLASIRVNKEKFKEDTLITIPTNNGLSLTGIGLGGQTVEVGILDITASAD